MTKSLSCASLISPESCGTNEVIPIGDASSVSCDLPHCEQGSLDNASAFVCLLLYGAEPQMKFLAVSLAIVVIVLEDL